MKKRYYNTPKAVVLEDTVNGSYGALWGALLMVARAAAKAMKGGINLGAGIDEPNMLQRSEDGIKAMHKMKANAN